MFKEIMEQSTTIGDSLRGRLDEKNGTAVLGGLHDHLDSLLNASRVYITACGTSWHAALIGEYLIERLAKIPVEVDYASEFRYRGPIIDEKTVVIAVTQSGETADTLASVRVAKGKGATVLGICNVVGSSVARATHGGVYLHAGPEVGVASTKAFTSQVAVLTLLALGLGRRRGLPLEEGRSIVRELRELPARVSSILKASEVVRDIAQRIQGHSNVLYLGRGCNFPIALEGALKLKEISYIHAEGYPGAEIKHGAIALIDEEMPVVCVAIQDDTYQKILSNMQEVKARHGVIIAIVSEGDTEVAAFSDYVIPIPKTRGLLTPILAVIPMQLLAYYVAVHRGCDVDRPRNLAKSVTVE